MTDIEKKMQKRAKEVISKLTLEEKISQLLHEAEGIDRLGIKPYNWWSEALHGVARCGRATVFPEPIGIAATFDEDLMLRIGDAVASEGRAKFNIAQSIRRPYILVSQREHLPRPSLGPWNGDLRRGSVPGKPHGSSLR